MKLGFGAYKFRMLSQNCLLSFRNQVIDEIRANVRIDTYLYVLI
jgi:hypothetical protein